MKKEKPPELKYYDVKIECSLPAVLHYRVLAESPEDACEKIKNTSPNGVKYKLLGRKDTRITVYDMGTSLIRLVRNLIGILR